tara:strand:+ start:100 stop:582 length:483 start_codon:yes stop_codon:yes gene_type:complete
MSLNNDFFSGQYTVDELTEIADMNKRERGTKKPNTGFYQKNMTELGPSWEDKRNLVRYLIEDSNITPISKNYLKDCEDWIPRYQYRGFKYGLATSAITYCFFPIIRKQPFTRRFLISTLPMMYFMKWGHTWGHENFWRRAKEVVVTYEIMTGTRNKFTMK